MSGYRKIRKTVVVGLVVVTLSSMYILSHLQQRNNAKILRRFFNGTPSMTSGEGPTREGTPEHARAWSPDEQPRQTVMNITEYGFSAANITKDDYYRPRPEIVNIWSFPVVISPTSPCSNKSDLLLVAMVITRADHVDYRKYIRQTWGAALRTRKDTALAFVIGKPRYSSNDVIIKKEVEEFGDIIQFDFKESYDNLTIKSMMSLRWASKHCAHARYVIKIDDDLVVNPWALMDSLRYHSNHSVGYHGGDRVIVGCHVGGRPARRVAPWNITVEQYPFRYLTRYYMEGPIYAVSMAAAHALLMTSRHVPYVQLEDLYVTGILPVHANVTLVSDGRWDLSHHGATSEIMATLRHALYTGKRTAMHHMSLDWRRVIWTRLLKSQLSGVPVPASRENGTEPVIRDTEILVPGWS